MSSGNFYEEVYEVVRRIPTGSVTSYGRIAQMLGRPNAARAVGYALSALKDHAERDGYADIPWHRVINSQGRISIKNREHSALHQAELLRAEGVAVNSDLKVDLDKYLWEGLHWLEIDDILRAGKEE
jgi:methylated-DNA-protein-cysteine methyltransferase-like protein